MFLKEPALCARWYSITCPTNGTHPNWILIFSFYNNFTCCYNIQEPEPSPAKTRSKARTGGKSRTSSSPVSLRTCAVTHHRALCPTQYKNIPDFFKKKQHHSPNQHLHSHRYGMVLSSATRVIHRTAIDSRSVSLLDSDEKTRSSNFSCSSPSVLFLTPPLPCPPFFSLPFLNTGKTPRSSLSNIPGSPKTTRKAVTGGRPNRAQMLRQQQQGGGSKSSRLSLVRSQKRQILCTTFSKRGGTDNLVCWTAHSDASPPAARPPVMANRRFV